MKPQQQQIYGERIFIRPPLKTTVFTIMAVSQLPVRSHFTAGKVFMGDYSIGLIVLPLFSFSFQWSIICSAKENEEFYIIQMIL